MKIIFYKYFLSFLSFNHPLNWEYTQRIAPLATPETMSEASNSPSPLPPTRPIRRTPKISGNLSTAADDLKSNIHFAMLAAKNYGLCDEIAGSNSSSGNSEASYETAKSQRLGGLPPPPVPRRRDSVILRRYIILLYKSDIIYEKFKQIE